MPMDEPLAKVAWEFYVDVIVAHNVRMLGYERKDTILFVYLYIYGWRGLRYFIWYVCRFVGSII